jgi:hypothetical protein
MKILLLLPLVLLTPTTIAHALTLDPNSYQAGYQYVTNDWNQHVPGGTWDQQHPGNNYSFECPLSHTVPYPDFCKGYDAALKYQNSDQ